MSRTVATPHDAHTIAYLPTPGDDFDEIVDDIQFTLARLWPSLDPADRWVDREIREIADNALASVTISEYRGLTALSLVPAEDNPLSTGWCNNIAPRFLRAFATLRHEATFSNGEAIYRATP